VTPVRDETHHNDQLDELIERADDPLLKAMLLVMRKMSGHLDDQMHALRELADAVSRIDRDVDLHRANDDRRVAGAKGAMWGAGLLVGALFTLVAYVLAAHIAADAKDSDQIRVNSVRLSVMEYQLSEAIKRLNNGR
jgi:hypothetical protein